MTDRDKKIKAIQEDYEYGFETETDVILETGKGLNEDVIRQISAAKDEPEWMLEYRLESYKIFKEKTNPKWGPDLSNINFDDFTYFVRNIDGVKNSWDDVPEEIKTTFERLGIPQAEREYLAGVSTQFESEVVYHSTQTELDEAGIIYLDTDSALKKYPEIFKKYFGTVVPNHDNKYAALNGAVWVVAHLFMFPKELKYLNLFNLILE